MSDATDALRTVLSADPQNHQIRLLLARQLVTESQPAEATAEYLLLKRAGALPSEELTAAVTAAHAAQQPDVIGELIAEPSGAPVDAELDTEALVPELVSDGPPPAAGDEMIEAMPDVMTFDDVGGLDNVKKSIRRLIIQPLERPELFAKYGKRAGGGVLLYGPPGCGKTLMARATAGEAGLPFYNVRIEDIVDPYFGVSEQRLAAAFDAARELRPCILFIDELDALGFARSNQRSDRGRSLVEVLLQQLDSIGSDNEDVLVLAASNEPWDIDGALMRPGRFDRTVFVPPPDDTARRAILERRLGPVPTAHLDVKRVVKSTPMYSGADLAELVERALEEVLDEAMSSGAEPPLTQTHLDAALVDLRPTTAPWLQRARNHVEFGNVGGRWDDVAAYLKQRSVARMLRQGEQL